MDKEELRKLISYNPETGEFIRIGYYCRWGTFVVRNNPLTKLSNEGYLVISIDGSRYKAHRLAFLYMDGISLQNDFDVDHINGDKSDNRYENLKLCSREENMKNKPLYSNNTTGVIGVCRYKDKFRARINVNGERIELGVFDSIAEAASVRVEYEKKFGYSEFHGRNYED